MTVQPSKTFCIMPWIHIYVNPDGSVLPCCIGHHHYHLGNTQVSTLKEIWNGEKYREMRRNMLEGKRCSQCSACYNSEDIGLKSARQHFNENHSKFLPLITNTNDDGSLDDLTLRYFDVRWSNICNFKCRTCSGTYSSSWAKEDSDNGYKRPIFIYAGGKNNDDLYDQFLPYFQDMESFYFAGGEPLLTDKHYDMLEYLISIGKTDVKLRYNSNLSVLEYKKKSVLDLWKQFSNVGYEASLDSWGERAEYIREGTEWNKIESNIRRIREETPHVELQTNTVVSVFNIATLDVFLKYMVDKSLFFKEEYYPNFYNLLHPPEYSVNVLSDTLKGEIRARLESINISADVNSKIQNVIQFLDASSYDLELHKQFIKKTQSLDAIRNQNFVSTFPELRELYEILL